MTSPDRLDPAWLRAAAAAYRAGRDAAQTREPRRNPYDGASTDPLEAGCARLWARGFRRANIFRGA